MYVIKCPIAQISAFILISQVSPLLAAEPKKLPKWTTADQIVTRYGSFQEGVRTDIILPLRSKLKETSNRDEMLASFLVCVSKRDTGMSLKIMDTQTRQSESVPLGPMAAAGPEATPFCFAPSQLSLSWNRHDITVVYAETPGASHQPYRSVNFEFPIYKKPSHLLFTATADSAYFGVLHLWTVAGHRHQPIPTFVCLTTTDVPSKITVNGPDHVQRTPPITPLQHGCYGLGDLTFDDAGPWTFEIREWQSAPGDSRQPKVTKFDVNLELLP